MPITVTKEGWRLEKPFKIARGVKTTADTIFTCLSDGVDVGCSECVPYARYGENQEDVADEIFAWAETSTERAKDPVAFRAAANEALGPGAARNALDCALWHLESLQTGRSVSERAGLSPPPSVVTAQTLSLADPDAMAQDAETRAKAGASLLKAKLGAGDVAEETARLRSIRAAAPKARIIVDANEGWSIDTLQALDPICAEIDALFIEQPLPSAQDADLDGLSFKTPLCADESCHTSADLPALKGRYQVVNLKLDKTGGFTEALALRQAALDQGFGLMIGCMVSTSLAMAPAYHLVEGALAVDLDGPLMLEIDRIPPIRYKGAQMFHPPAELWG